MNIIVKLIIAVTIILIMVYVITQWILPTFGHTKDCLKMGGYWYNGTECPINKYGFKQQELTFIDKSGHDDQICCSRGDSPESGETN